MGLIGRYTDIATLWALVLANEFFLTNTTNGNKCRVCPPMWHCVNNFVCDYDQHMWMTKSVADKDVEDKTCWWIIKNVLCIINECSECQIKISGVKWRIEIRRRLKWTLSELRNYEGVKCVCVTYIGAIS